MLSKKKLTKIINLLILSLSKKIDVDEGLLSGVLGCLKIMVRSEKNEQRDNIIQLLVDLANEAIDKKPELFFIICYEIASIANIQLIGVFKHYLEKEKFYINKYFDRQFTTKDGSTGTGVVK